MRFIKRHLWVIIFSVTIIAGIWEIRTMMRKEKTSLPSAKKSEFVPAEFPNKMLLTVHLDLKGAPPNFLYLKTLLPKMAAAGCDSLLIEYEDMFPYKGKLTNLSATNHYSPAQIREMIGWAHDLGMQVIPLVQSFGHLESALKLKEWAHLRELYEYPSEICPSHPDSFSLVTEMISQVMRFHRNSPYLHIGCDEVFHLNLCPKCRERALSSRALFEDHVIRLAKWLKERYPEVQPIIWDDMMRKWPAEDIINTRLAAHVVPMVWDYTSDVKYVQRVWWLYAKAFPKIWVAGAFKGAGEPRSDFPHIERRLANQRSWLELIHTSKTSHKVSGLALTGWSRFDHFAVLCELLPVAIPSLLLNLLYVKAHLGGEAPQKQRMIYREWQDSLGCPGRIIPENMNTIEGRDDLMDCIWPGVDLYKSLVAYRELKNEVKKTEHIISERQGYLTRYNAMHNFTNPKRVVEIVIERGVQSTLRQLEKLKEDIYRQLVWYTDDFTAKEWVEDRVLPLTSSLMSLNALTDALLARRDWPRRPLETNIPLYG
uniref:beta-N-acetylhexosaminidase n=2 Tax=Lygus hesperus TaxID=30085 RepID=A0A0A9YMF3_LYGHE